MKKRKLSWSDVKKVVEFKTFLLVVFFSIIGMLCIALAFTPMPKTVQDIFSAIGITFLTSATVSVVMEIFMRTDIVDFMSERMLSVMPAEIKGNTGVSIFKRDRSKVNFQDFLLAAVDYAKIIGVSANDILAPTNIIKLKEVLNSRPMFYVQVLLLSPWSITANIRSQACVYRTRLESISKTWAVIKDVLHLRGGLLEPDKQRVELRLYNDIPTLSMVIDARQALIAPFMAISQGGASPYFIALDSSLNSSVYPVYKANFDAIWDRAERVDSMDDLESVFKKQLEHDSKLMASIPTDYNDWLLSLEKA